MITLPSLNQILSRSPVVVSAATRLFEAMSLMQAENVTAVVVTEGLLPIGILTESDILRILASGASPGQMIVGNIMTSPPILAVPEMDFFDAYHLCAAKKIRHLLVVNSRGELCGLASESDFLRILGVDVLSNEHSIGRDMIRLPLLLPPDMPLLDVIRRISAVSGGAAIATVDGKPVGILTERDVISLAHTPIEDKTLADVMTSPVLTHI